MNEIFFLGLIILVIGFTINMFIHVLNSELSIVAKIVWSIVILTTTLLGASLYFISDHGKSKK